MRALERLLARRRAVVAVFLLAAAALLPASLTLESDNSPEVFFLRGSPALARYDAFGETFPGGKTVRLAVSGPRLFTAEGISWLTRLEEEASAVPGVAAAAGLAAYHRRRLPVWPPAAPGAFGREAAGNALDRGLGWIGEEGEVATVTVSLREAGGAELERTLAGLRGLAAGSPPGLATRLVGMPVLQQALDLSVREVEGIFFPLLVAVTVAFLAAVFRDAGSVLVPLVFVAVVEILLLGGMGLAGVRLNLVLAVLPPLLFAIALATAVHLVTTYRRRQATGEEEEAAAATLATYREKGWPVFWTGVTTLIGFASLAASPVGPVRDLGIWSAVGIAVMTVAAFSLLPALLAAGWMRPRAGAAGLALQARLGDRGRRWAEGAVRRRGRVLAGAVAVAALAAAGLPRLAVETNALHYLAPDHPARAGIEELERHGIGSAALELVLRRAGEEESFRSPAALAALAELEQALREVEGVLGVVGAGTLVDDLLARTPAAILGPSAGRAAVLAGMEADPQGREALARFLVPEGRAARVSVFPAITGAAEAAVLAARVEDLTRERFPEARVETTGEYPLLLASQRQLLRTLGSSLALTVAAVGVVFLLLLRSLPLALLALVPNVWPIVGVLGAMAWTGAPVDIASVMVAAIVLGLAVDDTIHTLGHFRRLAPRLGRSEAIAGTLERTAPAYLVTGVILAAGFGVSAFSAFAPLRRFGVYSALAIALAVLANLFLVPALLGGPGRRAQRARGLE